MWFLMIVIPLHCRMIFFLSTLVTAAVFISDHADGVWDRSLVSGK